MKATRYFEEQVLRKRPYIQRSWCDKALAEPARRETQENGRIRQWAWIPEEKKFLRVVTLADGQTVHNAFFDHNFKLEGKT